MIKPQKYTAICTAKERVSAKVYVAEFAILELGGMRYQPGHTIMLMIAPAINRSMSIASAPRDEHKFTLAYDVSPGGPGSQWMMHLNIGDSIPFMGPLGKFLWDEASPRKKVFVATGTGIAPYRAMLDHWLDLGAPSQISLYWGLRHEEDIFWHEYITQMVQAHPNLHYLLTLSKPTPAWGGPKGHVTDHLFVQEAQMSNSDFYLCGNRAMVSEVYERLLAAKVPEAQVKRELFF